jgi:phage tail protein X
MVRTYRVRKGDTLGRLAREFYGEAGRFPLIVAANDITDPDRLKPGQELIIPDLATASAGAPPPPLDPAAALNRRRLAGLHPILATRAASLIELCAHSGIALLITQGIRTVAEQDALYAQGRSRPGKIVTWARGGQSYHNYGLAFDFVPLDALGKADWDVRHPAWQRTAELGESVGLEWGGRWSPKKRDMPHFQYTCGHAIGECLVWFDAGGLAGVWAQVR